MHANCRKSSDNRSGVVRNEMPCIFHRFSWHQRCLFFHQVSHPYAQNDRRIHTSSRNASAKAQSEVKRKANCESSGWKSSISFGASATKDDENEEEDREEFSREFDSKV